MNIETRPIASLKPHPRNYRRHSQTQMTMLRESWRIHGQQKPLVIRGDGMILAGHGLAEAARLEGAQSIICHVYDGPEEYAEAFLIADNRTNELGENDLSALGDLIESLDDGSISMTATGYDDEALAKLMQGLDDATSRLRERVVQEQWQVLIECSDEEQQRDLLERLAQEGYQCRALTS